MKHKGLLRLTALLAAAAAVICLWPGAALANNAPQLESPSVTYLREENAFIDDNMLVAGKEATLYIPVINRGDAAASNIVCELPYSGDALAFPFESAAQANAVAAPFKKYDPAGNNGAGELVDWDGASLGAGERAWFQLTGFTALASLAQGSMELVFQVSFAEGGPVNIKLTVTVTNTAWTPSSGGGSSYRSKPKVIIEAYSFENERIYAGDTIRVNISVRNTSLTEAITNLQLDFSDEGGKILPVSGGSNSVFLGSIEKGEAHQMVLFLSVAPDAEAKTYPLSVKLVYEGTRNRSEFTEETSIAIAVLQRIRVRITEPAIYGDPWVGQGVSMGISLYNLSKATIYNCSVDVAGEGLSLEEPFFGGNIAAGNTMRADISVISELGGDVNGQIVVSYEDVYGEVSTETVDLSMFVNEMAPVAESEPFAEPTPGEPAPSGRGMTWYWWLLIAVVVIAGAVVLVIVLRKRRKKYLEEL
ncbi:MAG: hypothetical protein Q4C13_04190 [Clostridia bacterium]|nr:hypothetical protein [Clostridia bacterium]